VSLLLSLFSVQSVAFFINGTNTLKNSSMRIAVKLFFLSIKNTSWRVGRCEKTKFGTLINNSDNPSHDGRMLVSLAPDRGPNLKKYNFSDKNDCFPASIFYMCNDIFIFN